MIPKLVCNGALSAIISCMHSECSEREREDPNIFPESSRRVCLKLSNSCAFVSKASIYFLTIYTLASVVHEEAAKLDNQTNLLDANITFKNEEDACLITAMAGLVTRIALQLFVV